MYFFKIKYLALKLEALLHPYNSNCNMNISKNVYRDHMKIKERVELFQYHDI